MPLFDDVPRTDPVPRSNTESEFEFLNRVATPYWERVRNLLEDWFSHYPDAHCLDLRNRLRSDRDWQHRGAFFELYLYESLRRLGFAVTIHPSIPGTSAHPDFLARSPNFSCYIEATTVSDPHADTPQARVVLDAIKEVPSPNFFLDVNIEMESKSTPPLRALQHEVSGWLSELDPDEVSRRIQAAGGSIYSTEPLIWERAGWRIGLAAIPKSTGARGDLGDTVGMVSAGEAGWLVDTRDRVLRALSDKANCYGRLEFPYVVALYILDPFASGTEIESALAGLLSSQGRLPGGFWSGGRHRQVDGVLTVDALAAWTVARYAPVLWLNPDAGALDEQLPWQTVRFAPDLVARELTPAKMAGFELFELPADWPGGNPFERD